MNYTIPTKITCIIVSRRLNGTIQADSAHVIGLPSQITYDITSLDGRIVIGGMTSLIPKGRIVSPMGMQVNIEAAEAGSECTLEILDNGEERLFVRESIVFQDCQ